MHGGAIEGWRVEEDVAGERVAQEDGDVERIDRLGDGRGRASGEEALDRPRVAVAGEDGDRHGRMPFAQERDAVHAVEYLELEVEKHEIRARARDERRHLGAGARDSDDLEAVGVLQDLPDRLEDQRVVDRDDDGVFTACIERRERLVRALDVM